MEINMKEDDFRIKNKTSVFIITCQIMKDMKVTDTTVKNQDKEHIIFVTATNILEIGRRIRKMVKDN